MVQCIHGDLTTRNILLNGSHTVAKIGDLGLSRTLEASIAEVQQGFTIAFAAPEILLNMRCNEKVWQLLSLTPAWCSCQSHLENACAPLPCMPTTAGYEREGCHATKSALCQVASCSHSALKVCGGPWTLVC